VGAALLGADVACADVIDATWLGGTGNWHDPTKWSGGVVPNNTATSTFRAWIPSGAVSASEAAITLNALSLGSPSALSINALASLNVLNAEVNGNLTVRTGMTAGPLTGIGVITVGDGSSSARLIGTAAVDIGTGLTVEVKKYSGIGALNVPLVNRGHIVGGYPDWSFSPFVAAGAFQNFGTIESRNGAMVIASGGTFTRADLGDLLWTKGGKFAIAGTLLNSGETLHVDATREWAVVGGTVQGGILDIDSSTRMVFGGEFAASSLDDVVVNGQIRVINRNLDIRNGVLKGNADVLLATQYIAPPPRIITSSTTLTIESTVTIHGGDPLGSGIGNSTSAIVNHGTIRSEIGSFSPAQLNVIGPSVFNDGELSVAGASRIRVASGSASPATLTFGNGGSLNIDMSADPAFGLLQVEGLLDLSTIGDTLMLAAGPQIEPGTFYRVVTTTGGVLGQFDSVSAGFAVQYLGNDIYAAVIPEPGLSVPAMLLATLLRRRR
jgi:hypothetical protein